MQNVFEQPSLLFGLALLAVILAFMLGIRSTSAARKALLQSEAQLRGELAEGALRQQEALSRAERSETREAERARETARLEADLAEERMRFESQGTLLRNALAEEAKRAAQIVGAQESLQEQRAKIQTGDDEIADLRKRLEEEQKAQQSLVAKIAGLKTELAAERRQGEEKIALLSKVREEMQERFKLLASEALQAQGEAFSKSNVEKLEATLTPLKVHVGHFEKELRAVHQETAKDRERLKAEILQLSQRSEAISQEAVALTRALKGDTQKQGAWGEMILETILQRSGLREGTEYEVQAKRSSAEGDRLRPDVVIHIPGGKSLVVDSKVSLNDYAAALNSESEEAAAPYRRAHVAAMRAHINGLSSKGYHLAEGHSVDYVIMFVPIEGALSEALRQDGTLTEYALQKNITIATPTTLMMALRTVSHVWTVERRNKNAEDIARRAGLLYDKVAGFVTSMEKVGKGIESANRACDDALGQLARGRGNVLSQVESLKALGGKASKTISFEFEGKSEAIQIASENEDLGLLAES